MLCTRTPNLLEECNRYVLQRYFFKKIKTVLQNFFLEPFNLLAPAPHRRCPDPTQMSLLTGNSSSAARDGSGVRCSYSQQCRSRAAWHDQRSGGGGGGRDAGRRRRRPSRHAQGEIARSREAPLRAQRNLPASPAPQRGSTSGPASRQCAGAGRRRHPRRGRVRPPSLRLRGGRRSESTSRTPGTPARVALRPSARRRVEAPSAGVWGGKSQSLPRATV